MGIGGGGAVAEEEVGKERVSSEAVRRRGVAVAVVTVRVVGAATGKAAEAGAKSGVLERASDASGSRVVESRAAPSFALAFAFAAEGGAAPPVMSWIL